MRLYVTLSVYNAALENLLKSVLMGRRGVREYRQQVRRSVTYNIVYKLPVYRPVSSCLYIYYYIRIYVLPTCKHLWVIGVISKTAGLIWVSRLPLILCSV